MSSPHKNCVIAVRLASARLGGLRNPPQNLGPPPGAPEDDEGRDVRV